MLHILVPALLWTTNITYMSTEGVLNVSFLPAKTTFNYTRYEVSLWRLQSQNTTCDGLPGHGHSVEEKKVEPSWPTTDVSFVGWRTKGYYCIRVEPLSVGHRGNCKIGCRAHRSKTFFLPEKKFTGVEVNCRKQISWKADIVLQPDIKKKAIKVKVLTICPFIQKLEIALWINASKNCNGLTGKLRFTKVVSINETGVTFSPLEKGCYCARVTPLDHNCQRQNLMTLFTNCAILPDFKDTLFFPWISKSSNDFPDWVIITTSVGLVTLVLISCLLVGCRKCKRADREQILGDLDKDAEEDFTNPNERIQVSLLYSHDCFLHTEVVRDFVTFLKDCWNAEVIWDLEYEDEIMVNPEGWALRLIACECQNEFWYESESEIMNSSLCNISPSKNHEVATSVSEQCPSRKEKYIDIMYTSFKKTHRRHSFSSQYTLPHTNLGVHESSLNKISDAGIISSNQESLCDLKSTNHYGKLSLNKKKVVIVIESEGAVYRQIAWQEGKVVHNDNIGYLDKLFIYSLSALTTDLVKCVGDYSHLVVIRFPYTAPGLSLGNIVPHRRFTIPDHLVELYWKLRGEASNCNYELSEEKLLQRWRYSSAYADFLKSINEMIQFTALSPNFIKEQLREEIAI
ncbi:uncharacterized protein LOC111085122 [Limulus polyphemus]|uniref:Uncharacterized protein LOC111085122 n=1 Tax=Limulus polyphemus TaxID=6850 RepID=A0ABM1S388_LIMPO|nr:uncharacterized protein LOC111085122 [Limulus polyphemus]